ncbi:hypothetical protein CAEBREN_03835 [Caenorhabditis brenneri]|uniref:Uncharacterized protein n=1 Tax=Caenorhabditis brenneri TaxID=135651 RepID=G0MYI8_CAEBE|nr:hypothetical protein CAEBREN_03835 [Caenorhabditis brenneri]
MDICKNEQLEAICNYALALRRSDKSDCFDMYILGHVDPDTMSACIIHNNEHHDGCTYTQLGHMTRILDARTAYLDQQYKKNILQLTEKHVDQYNYRKLVEKYGPGHTILQYGSDVIAKVAQDLKRELQSVQETTVENSDKKKSEEQEKVAASKDKNPVSALYHAPIILD